MPAPPQPGAPGDDPEEPGEPGGGPFPFGGSSPFGGELDFSKVDFSKIDLSQLMRMLQSEGPVNWEVARQTAVWVALEGRPDPAVAPADHARFEELAKAAQTLVVGETGLAATFATELRTVGPEGWVDLHLVALRPVLEALATNLGDTMKRAAAEADPEEQAEAEAMLGALPQGAFPFPLQGMGSMLGMLAPMLLGIQAGSMIGYLAQHALGRYDLPLPTGAAPLAGTEGGDAPSLCFVVSNIDRFEAEWSLPRDDLRFLVALHETVHAAIRSVPWVRGLLVQLAIDYVSGYEVDPAGFEAEFGVIDPQDPSSIARMTEHPERVLGAMQSARQQRPLEELQRLTSVMTGYADVVLARIGRRLVPSYDRIHEAIARHRVERGEAERFIETLLGLRLTREHFDRGHAFCDGVVERAGMEGLNRVWERAAMLPTPSELEAPGLWLARIDLPEQV